MNMRLITYRTKDARHNDYAVLPDLYVSDTKDFLRFPLASAWIVSYNMGRAENKQRGENEWIIRPY